MMTKAGLANHLIRSGWDLVSVGDKFLRLSRENYIEHMGDVYATQDTIALAKQTLGDEQVKVVRFKHYQQERIELTLTM
jgi:hypothetical protein